MRRKELKLILSIFLFICLTFLIIKIGESNDLNNKSPLNNYNNFSLKTGDLWILSPFVIDESGGGDFTWNQAVNQPWCVGNGTYEDPYLIENITINGGGSSNCIQIKNSNKYFIINNCSLFNSGTSSNSGISLNNVSNGLIINNNCSIDHRYGISLTSSINNSIMDNTCNDNFIAGIYLEDNCHNNSITKNTAKFNNDGIHFDSDCHDNIIHRNIIEQSRGRGIFLDNNCDSNNITDNIVNHHRGYGMNIEDNCDMNIIKNNSFSNNLGVGVYLPRGSDNEFIDNEVKNNGDHGIYDRDGDGNKFINNNISNNKKHGLYLDRSENTVVRNNSLNYNYYGIYSSYSRSINLTLNSMKMCSVFIANWIEDYASINIDKTNHISGKSIYYYVNKPNLNNLNFSNPGQIILFNCSKFSITDLIFPIQSVPIMLIESSDGIIRNINASNNLVYGMYLNTASNNLIEENFISRNNDTGLYLYDSNNNTILNNTIRNNRDRGIFIKWFSNNNNLTKNFIGFNGNYEVYLENSFGNHIFKNQVYYSNFGIHIIGDGNFIALNNFTGDYSKYIIQPGNSSEENQDVMNLVNNVLTSIYIDENYYEYFHWAYLANKYNWCFGSGTEIDPFIINNVSINGNDFGSCLTIKNSNVSFKITNSSFYNSYRHSAGMLLRNTSNGKIVDNDCRWNNGFGILLKENCTNNLILRNYATGLRGIYLSKNCNENEVAYNRVNSIELSINCNDNNV